MSTHRSTFSLAQLLLLTMLTGLLCAWLPTAVRWNQQNLSGSTEKQESILSEDGTVYFCRLGQEGFAAFDSSSGRQLTSESMFWEEDVRFDPASYRIIVCTELPEKPHYTLRKYALRIIDPGSGVIKVATSPVPESGMKLRFRSLVQSGEVPQVRNNYVYDFLCPLDSIDDSSEPTHLRCWDVSSETEKFCVPIGTIQVCWDAITPAGFFYVSHEHASNPLGQTSRQDVIFRNHENGDLRHSFYFSEKDMYSLGGLAVCHRSDNFALLFPHFNSERGVVTRNSSDIFLAGKDPNLPRKIASLDDIYASQIAMESNDETIWLLGTRKDGTQVLLRRNLETGKSILTVKVGAKDATLATDFKLFEGKNEVALAYDDGTFRVLAVEKGNELRRLSGLKYAPNYTQLYILAGAGLVWSLLWWSATSIKHTTPSDLSRLIGFVVALIGFVEGLFLLGLCDSVHSLGALATAAVVVPSLSAITGIVLLFQTRWSKLTIIYGILASMVMAAYTIWAAGKYS